MIVKYSIGTLRSIKYNLMCYSLRLKRSSLSLLSVCLGKVQVDYPDFVHTAGDHSSSVFLKETKQLLEFNLSIKRNTQCNIKNT